MNNGVLPKPPMATRSESLNRVKGSVLLGVVVSDPAGEWESHSLSLAVIIESWNGLGWLPREMVGSPALVVLIEHGDVRMPRAPPSGKKALHSCSAGMGTEPCTRAGQKCDTGGDVRGACMGSAPPGSDIISPV